jgi:Predicted hydrolases or acyltransferases (alpha/beta hydrolase superfamily)
MKGHYLLLAGALLASSSLGGAVTYKRYRRWHEKEVARLTAGSQIMQTAQGPVEYTISGSGPALLISHGSPGGYDLGAPLAALLAAPQSYTYISVSRPGYLRTPLSSGETPEEQADLYAALLSALHIQQATVIALSGGGPAALQFALRHPDRCRALVVISGVAQHYSEEEIWQSFSPLKRYMRKLYAKLTTLDILMYLILPLARLQPAGPTAFELARTATLYDQRKIGYENDMRQFAKITRYPLAEIKVPTFVVHGTADDEVFFADAELLAREIPNVRLLAISKGSHMTFYTHAATVMPALRAFLANVTGITENDATES